MRPPHTLSVAGVTIFRGLVERAMASELQPTPGSPVEEEPELLDWELQQLQPEQLAEQPRRPSALLAVVAEARQHQLEEAEAAAVRREAERRRREAAAEAAERWEGAPERLAALHIAGCRLGAAGGCAAALLLSTNRTLTHLSLANNHLGQVE